MSPLLFGCICFRHELETRDMRWGHYKHWKHSYASNGHHACCECQAKMDTTTRCASSFCNFSLRFYDIEPFRPIWPNLSMVDGIFLAGSWKCTNSACGNVNFAARSECNWCHQPRSASSIMPMNASNAALVAAAQLASSSTPSLSTTATTTSGASTTNATSAAFPVANDLAMLTALGPCSVLAPLHFAYCTWALLAQILKRPNTR